MVHFTESSNFHHRDILSGCKNRFAPNAQTRCSEIHLTQTIEATAASFAHRLWRVKTCPQKTRVVKHKCCSRRFTLRGAALIGVRLPPRKNLVSSTTMPSSFLCLDGIFPGPFPCRSLVPGAVGFVHVRDFGDERIIRVGVGQHRANRQ